MTIALSFRTYASIINAINNYPETDEFGHLLIYKLNGEVEIAYSNSN